MSHFLQNHTDGLDQRWQRNLYSLGRNLFWTSILAAFRQIRLHEHTHKHADIYTHTWRAAQQRKHPEVKKKEGKETKGEQKMLPGTKPPQTNTQSKFYTMHGKTRPHYSSGHDMRTHTGCDYRLTQANLHQSKHTDKSSMTKSIWHIRLEGWNPTLGKITNTLRFKW